MKVSMRREEPVCERAWLAEAATATGRPAGHLCLAIAEQALLYPLPARGEVIVGRDVNVALSVDNRSLSRRHALIRVGSGLTIEDLGSKNGTYVHGCSLPPGEQRQLVLGDGVLLGTMVLGIVARGTLRGGDIWDAEAFEALVRYECQRARRTGLAFSTLRIRRTGVAVQNDLQGLLRQVLGAGRPLASFGNDSYLVLVFSNERPEAMIERLKAEATQHGISFHFEITRHPMATAPVATAAPEPTSAHDEADKRQRIAAALEACGGNQSRAAHALGVSRQTLIRWVEQYGLPRPREPKALLASSVDPLTKAEDAADRTAIEDALVRCGGNQVNAAELLQISRSTLIRRMQRYGIRRRGSVE